MRLFTPDIQAVLDAHGFDTIPFDEHRRQLAVHGFDRDRYRVSGHVEIPGDFGMRTYPVDPDEKARLRAIGQEALAARQVGVVVLNGGMATRFGGGAKGTFRVFPGKSFLQLKIDQVKRAGGDGTPIILMNSFATEQATREHLAEVGLLERVETIVQNVSVRLTASGEVFRDPNGRPSLYAPGHGDFQYVMASSGVVDRLDASGVRWITLSNVDNLGAALDPVIIGMHIDAGLPVSVELVDTLEGDVGGFPAAVDGRMMILEGFRMPVSFDAGPVRVFNTNTFVFESRALRHPPELDWFAVAKKVDGTEVIQFERLVGQLTEHLETGWLHVPREGPGSRFVPIKTPEELEARRDELLAVLRGQGLEL